MQRSTDRGSRRVDAARPGGVAVERHRIFWGGTAGSISGCASCGISWEFSLDPSLESEAQYISNFIVGIYRNLFRESKYKNCLNLGLPTISASFNVLLSILCLLDEDHIRRVIPKMTNIEVTGIKWMMSKDEKQSSWACAFSQTAVKDTKYRTHAMQIL